MRKFKRSSPHPLYKCCGFTLVELLVVIAIIGILVALLLPAVQAARESARRIQCTNNLKQIALATINYADTLGSFPTATAWPSGSDMDTAGNVNFGPNWIILTLPFMEEQALYDMFDLTKSIADSVNRPAVGTRIPTLLCPSDLNNGDPFDGTGVSGVSHYGAGWERNNYGANAGTGMLSDSAHCGQDANAGCSGQAQFWRLSHVQGVMGANLTTRIADIRDGTTNTFLILEIRAGVKEFDVRGTWAIPGAGPSAVGAYGYFGDARGPNTNAWLQSDDIPGCQAIRDAVGDPSGVELQRMGMSCCACAESSPNRQAAARSLHPGGLLAAMCDGSVQFIGDYIDSHTTRSITPKTETSPEILTKFEPSVWDRLILSADGSPVPGDAF